MTFREKLKKEKPEYVKELFVGGCSGCPGEKFPELDDRTIRNCGGCARVKCTVCWDREIPETKEEKNDDKTVCKKLDCALEIIKTLMTNKDRSIKIVIKDDEITVESYDTRD